MTNNHFTYPRKNQNLYGLGSHLDLLVKLDQSNKLPQVLLLCGKKGTGKFTLISHFMNYVFDKKNYNLNKRSIDEKTIFYNQFVNNTHPNIVFLNGDSSKSIKIEDVRNLRLKLYKSLLSEKKRFIILDDIELFNENSLNALLKIIEEPPKNNYFLLINNNSKPLMDTIISRSLELKISLSNEKRLEAIESLIKENNLKNIIDYKPIDISPGFFLFLNNFFYDQNIDINDNFIINLEKILVLYKKNKDIKIINALLFLTDYYFYQLQKRNVTSIDNIVKKSYLLLIILINLFLII